MEKKWTYHAETHTYQATFEGTTLVTRGDVFLHEDTTNILAWYEKLGQDPIVVWWRLPDGHTITQRVVKVESQRTGERCGGCGTWEDSVKNVSLPVEPRDWRRWQTFSLCQRCAQHVAQQLLSAWAISE